MIEFYERPPNKKKSVSSIKTFKFLKNKAINFFFIGISSFVILIAGIPLVAVQWQNNPQLGYLAITTLTVYLLIMFWVYRENGGQRHRKMAAIKQAITAGKVKVVHCQSQQMIALTGIEDEGAEYFFAVAKDKTFYLGGQQYYPTRSFPNTDFEIIEIWSLGPFPVHSAIRCYSDKFNPLRTIPADVKENMLASDRYPQDYDVIEGPLEQIETLIIR